MGLVLLTWLAVETTIVGYSGWQQIPMLAVCGACGAILVVVRGSAT